jgi:OOP family OmpA-OmpF porin
MRVWPFILLLPLVACAGDGLEKLRQATPTGTPFQQALAKYYLDFADQEADRFDWWSSQHFASKGLAASYGSDVQPEKMEYWNLEIKDKNEREALAQARAWLEAHRAAHADHAPDDVAKAQVYFDCWIEEATEMGASKARAHCREELEGLLLKLGPIVHSSKGVHIKDPLKAPQVTLTYLVFFDLGSAELNRDAMEVLDIIMTDLHNVDDYEIVLNGHADTSGTQEKNMELSLKRAKRVEKKLLEAGVPSNLISLYAFGETDPKDGSPDGQRSKVNRRVEVVIN